MIQMACFTSMESTIFSTNTIPIVPFGALCTGTCSIQGSCPLGGIANCNLSRQSWLHFFSGSAVYDRENTSGLGTEETPPIVAVFTYHDMAGEKSGATDFQSQGIAFSVDKGRTWTKYEGNPVLPNQEFAISVIPKSQS